MAFVNPFAQPGRWYRGNTHCHSTSSDGDVTRAQRCAAYREAGYDFLVFTDHDLIGSVDGLSDSDLLVIPGAELHPENPYGGDRYHIVSINIVDPIDARNMPALAVLEAIRAQGGLAVLAHPYWSGHLLSDYEPLRGLYDGMEIYNHCCGHINGTFGAELLWDAHLDRLGSVWGLAADDAHYANYAHQGGWIMVRAESLEVRAIVDALRTGSFYATQGPVIESLHVERADGQVTVRIACSPVASIRFKGRTYTGAALAPEDSDTLVEATYVCRGNEKYIRAEITDHEGRKAWTNPVYLDQIQ